MGRFDIDTRDTLATWLDTTFMPMAVQHVQQKQVIEEQKSENERNRQYQLLENVYSDRLNKRDQLQSIIDTNSQKLEDWKFDQSKLQDQDKTSNFFDFIDDESKSSQALMGQIDSLNDEIRKLSSAKDFIADYDRNYLSGASAYKKLGAKADTNNNNILEQEEILAALKANPNKDKTGFSHGFWENFDTQAVLDNLDKNFTDDLNQKITLEQLRFTKEEAFKKDATSAEADLQSKGEDIMSGVSIGDINVVNAYSNRDKDSSTWKKIKNANFLYSEKIKPRILNALETGSYEDLSEFLIKVDGMSKSPNPEIANEGDAMKRSLADIGFYGIDAKMGDNLSIETTSKELQEIKANLSKARRGSKTYSEASLDDVLNLIGTERSFGSASGEENIINIYKSDNATSLFIEEHEELNKNNVDLFIQDWLKYGDKDANSYEQDFGNYLDETFNPDSVSLGLDETLGEVYNLGNTTTLSELEEYKESLNDMLSVASNADKQIIESALRYLEELNVSAINSTEMGDMFGLESIYAPSNPYPQK